MKNLTHTLFLVCAFSMPILYFSCDYPTDPNEPLTRLGWVPIYSKSQGADQIKMLSPQPVVHPGKIFLRNKYLLLNEQHKGVHVIDNSNPSSPVNIGFISIPGNLDVVMRGNILYTDFHNGIASIDLSNPTQATVLDYVPNVLSATRIKPIRNDSNQFDIYQCADTTQGVVIGWRKDSVDYGKCYGTIR